MQTVRNSRIRGDTLTYSLFDDFLPFGLLLIGQVEVHRECKHKADQKDMRPNTQIEQCFTQCGVTHLPDRDPYGGHIARSFRLSDYVAPSNTSETIAGRNCSSGHSTLPLPSQSKLRPDFVQLQETLPGDVVCLVAIQGGPVGDIRPCYEVGTNITNSDLVRES